MAKYLGRTQDQSGGTMRQQAFQESMDRITQGMGQLGGAIDKKRSTERQMALQEQSQRERNSPRHGSGRKRRNGRA